MCNQEFNQSYQVRSNQVCVIYTLSKRLGHINSSKNVQKESLILSMFFNFNFFTGF